MGVFAENVIYYVHSFFSEEKNRTLYHVKSSKEVNMNIILSIAVFSVLTYIFFKHGFSEAGYFSAFYLMVLIIYQVGLLVNHRQSK